MRQVADIHLTKNDAALALDSNSPSMHTFVSEPAMDHGYAEQECVIERVLLPV